MRWYPFSDIDRMMEEFWSRPFISETMKPAIDMFRENGKLVVKLDMNYFWR